MIIIEHYNVPQRYSEMLLSSANRYYIPNSQLTYHFSAAENMIPDKLYEKAPDLIDSERLEVVCSERKSSNHVSTNFAAHIWDTYSIGNSYNSLCVQSDTQQIFEYSLITLGQGIWSCSRWKKLVCTF